MTIFLPSCTDTDAALACECARNEPRQIASSEIGSEAERNCGLSMIRLLISNNHPSRGSLATRRKSSRCLANSCLADAATAASVAQGRGDSPTPKGRPGPFGGIGPRSQSARSRREHRLSCLALAKPAATMSRSEPGQHTARGFFLTCSFVRHRIGWNSHRSVATLPRIEMAERGPCAAAADPHS